jgi:NADH-quinone oxidoreductase subunit N
VTFAAGLTGVQSVDALALAPVLAPVAGIVLILLLDALFPASARARRGHDAIALLALLAAGAAVVWLGHLDTELGTFCVPGQGLDVRSCSYVSSPFTLTVQGLAVAAAAICLLLAADGDGARDRAPHHLLLLTVVAGTVALAGARDLITLVVALETASLPGVALVALRRDAPAAQGALTMLLTAIGSLGVLLLGVSLLALATGALHLDRIAATLGDPGLPGPVRAVALVGTLLAVAGIGFKLSAVPFHLWTPDTYAGAPLPVAAFLAVVSKTAGVTAVVVLLTLGLPALASAWAPVVGIVAVVTVTVGNLVALRQRIAVRLLAWSTIAQAGWVLLPLAAAGDATPSTVRQAAAASIGYLVAYVAASLAAFAVVVVLARHHPAAEEHALDAYRGLVRREPVAATALGLALAALAGLPPGVVGLVAKVVAVRPLVNASMWPFAVIAAINVVLGIAYYLRWAALMFTPAKGRPITWRVRPFEGVALGAAAASVVALSVWPQAVAGVLPTLLR